MKWQVIMDEDGTITLPPDLIQKMGWTPETSLRWIEVEGGIALEPTKDSESVNS